MSHREAAGIFLNESLRPCVSAVKTWKSARTSTLNDVHHVAQLPLFQTFQQNLTYSLAFFLPLAFPHSLPHH